MPPDARWLACSREGAGIAEGLAVVALAVLVMVLVALAAAVLLGVWQGRRQGGGSTALIRRNLLVAAGVLLALPVLGYFATGVWMQFERGHWQRLAERQERWFAPVERADVGEIGPALDRLFDNPKAGLQEWTYAAHALVDWARRRSLPLDPQDREALAALPTRLRTRLDSLHSRMDPSNLDGLDGAIQWQLHRLDLLPGLAHCLGRPACLVNLVQVWRPACRADPSECVQSIDEPALNELRLRVRHDQHQDWQFEQVALAWQAARAALE